MTDFSLCTHFISFGEGGLSGQTITSPICLMNEDNRYDAAFAKLHGKIFPSVNKHFYTFGVQRKTGVL